MASITACVCSADSRAGLCSAAPTFYMAGQGFDKSFAEGLHGFVLFKSTFPIYGTHFSSILLRAFALRLSKCNGLLK